MNGIVKLTEARYGGLPDTLHELCQAGVISKEELNAFMLDLVMDAMQNWLDNE